MKTYEYKIIAIKAQLGLNFEKKCQELENNWNELGKQGWKFCTWGNDCAVFNERISKTGSIAKILSYYPFLLLLKTKSKQPFNRLFGLFEISNGKLSFP